MHRIIGITGRAGAGKDTVFRILDEQFADYNVNRLGFADALKESAMASLGLKRNVADVFKEKGTLEITIGATKIELSGREYLQRYGAEGHRDVFDEDFWVNAAFDRLQPGVTIITDVRFDNEAEAIHSMGGEVWLVERPGDNIEESGHSSESGINKGLIDAFLLNDGSIDDFRKQVLWAWGGTRDLAYWNDRTVEGLNRVAQKEDVARLFDVPVEVLSDQSISGSYKRDLQFALDSESELDDMPDKWQEKPDLKHNFLLRKHLSERAKLAHAELSECDIVFDAETGQPRPRLPW